MIWLGIFLSPIVLGLAGMVLLAVSNTRKPDEREAARCYFAAGAGAFIGGLACFLAIGAEVDGQIGQSPLLVVFPVVTVGWIAAWLVAARAATRTAPAAVTPVPTAGGPAATDARAEQVR